MRKEHQNQIQRIIIGLKEREIEQIYFVACGGSQALLMAGQYLFDKELSIPASVYTANEFIYDQPKRLNEKSMVISCSHSGTTPETINATKLARNMGAMTISLSNEEESPLWKAAEFPLHYDWGVEADVSDLNKGIFYGLLFSILNFFTKSDKWDSCLTALSNLNDLSTKAKEKYEVCAKNWGIASKRNKLIYTIGSGINFGEIYSTSACWFMEMQWIHSNAIHSGEYFHGPFEITDYDVPFILVKSIGKTRHLDQRVHDFIEKYTKSVLILDQKDFDLSTIDESAKEYIAAILSGIVIRQMVEELAFQRGHSLEVRRYMWQVNY
ncbi:SIS domain-containing protein [Enterococcus massiliensis]|uniref:SIS domain-containing protein n=1 Tax=Enterococcus massiliensis TaxID=1640685 RepID=UPI00065DF181|nr:SIS domain-containing protein [Enterococcus massiliensis]